MATSVEARFAQLGIEDCATAMAASVSNEAMRAVQPCLRRRQDFEALLAKIRSIIVERFSRIIQQAGTPRNLALAEDSTRTLTLQSIIRDSPEARRWMRRIMSAAFFWPLAKTLPSHSVAKAIAGLDSNLFEPVYPDDDALHFGQLLESIHTGHGGDHDVCQPCHTAVFKACLDFQRALDGERPTDPIDEQLLWERWRDLLAAAQPHGESYLAFFMSLDYAA